MIQTHRRQHFCLDRSESPSGPSRQAVRVAKRSESPSGPSRQAVRVAKRSESPSGPSPSSLAGRFRGQY
jgi:hypothetical protein